MALVSVGFLPFTRAIYFSQEATYGYGHVSCIFPPISLGRSHTSVWSLSVIASAICPAGSKDAAGTKDGTVTIWMSVFGVVLLWGCLKGTHTLSRYIHIPVMSGMWSNSWHDMWSNSIDFSPGELQGLCWDPPHVRPHSKVVVWRVLVSQKQCVFPFCSDPRSAS